MSTESKFCGWEENGRPGRDSEKRRAAYSDLSRTNKFVRTGLGRDHMIKQDDG
jgi:hypothetical protein